MIEFMDYVFMWIVNGGFYGNYFLLFGVEIDVLVLINL